MSALRLRGVKLSAKTQKRRLFRGRAGNCAQSTGGAMTAMIEPELAVVSANSAGFAHGTVALPPAAAGMFEIAICICPTG